MTKVLYIQPGQGMGGSHISLFHMLKCAPESQKSYLALSSPAQIDYEVLVKEHVEKIFYLDLPNWNKYRRRTLLEKVRAPFGYGIRLLKLIPATRKLTRIIKAEGIDLVHTNNSIEFAGALAAWITQKPHVWHIREAFGSKRQYRPILGDGITFWLMQKLSNVIICNSEYTAEPFRDRQIKHIVIQNGIDLTNYLDTDNRRETIRSGYGIKKDEILIGMVGNLSTELKRHNVFLDMAQGLNNKYHKLKFIIFGGSKNLELTEYTRSLSEQVTRIGLTERVIWADLVKDPAEMMSSLDILVHPALTEGSGRVIMEAMAAGKPVVAMKSGGVQELIRDGSTGFLVHPGRFEALVEKVEALLVEENLRKIIGTRARDYAQAYFSDQASMNAIVNIYTDLV